MNTTDNTNVEWKRTAMRQARELARARAQRDAALAALRDIETRAGYCVARPDKTNNDIQMEYIRQQASNAISTMESK